MVGALLSWPYFACQGRRRRREGGGLDGGFVFLPPFLVFCCEGDGGGGSKFAIRSSSDAASPNCPQVDTLGFFVPEIFFLMGALEL